MSKKVKDIILSSIVVLAGIMVIVGLATALYTQTMGAREASCTGFEYLENWNELLAEDGGYMFTKVAIILTIVCGALAIVAGLASIFVKKEALKIGGLVIAAVGAIFNLIAGIIMIGKVTENIPSSMASLVDTSTLAFLGLILVVVLAIAFFVVKKVIKDKE